jgi:hypothetical protein
MRICDWCANQTNEPKLIVLIRDDKGVREDPEWKVDLCTSCRTTYYECPAGPGYSPGPYRLTFLWKIAQKILKDTQEKAAQGEVA